MEQPLKIFELLGVNDFEELDQTQILVLYRISEEVENFGMYQCRDVNLASEGRLMQQEMLLHLRRVLASRDKEG
ncbi:TPA: hypothetical protein N2P55_003580 [Escherichia coli]|nr:hypothetical protein [Escherichia coli]HCL6287041.1 hypothetical protein [Escherichia coli]